MFNPERWRWQPNGPLGSCVYQNYTECRVPPATVYVICLLEGDLILIIPGKTNYVIDIILFV